MSNSGAARGMAFAGGLLVFLVQPVVARTILPWLGGSAQVWNGCTVFFQVTLLLGYLYAYLLSSRVPDRLQPFIHSLLVGLSLLQLPLRIEVGSGPPTSHSPLVWILVLLTDTMGLPFLVLSATTPLLQHWCHRDGGYPVSTLYSLYAASNAGAIAALVGYPLLVEPYLSLKAQAGLWSVGYSLLALLMIASVISLHRRPDMDSRAEGARPPDPESSDPLPPSFLETALGPFLDVCVGPSHAHADRSGTSSRPRGLWILLSLVPASLMLGVTSHITNEIPSFPLVWIAPLFLYLLSFILVFVPRPPLPHRLILAIQPFFVSLLGIAMFVPLQIAGLAYHLVAFFITALALHGELARLRPPSSFSCEYYLWIALGGSLGGLFNTLVAPHIFPCVVEYPLAVVVACLLRPLPCSPESGVRSPNWKRSEPWSDTLLDLLVPTSLAISTVALILALPRLGDDRDFVARTSILLFAAAVAHYFRGRPLRFGLSVAGVLAGSFAAFPIEQTLVLTRSDYAVSRVVRQAGTQRNLLVHGMTIHGAQDRSKTSGDPPSLYYFPESPIGRLMTTDAAKQARRFGVLGLGVGTLAWYVRPHQSMRFFEIDPMVRDLATDQRYFSFLSSARGSVDIVLGDGRLSLTREPDLSFDLIVADAFSSDAVPVHLITREAVELYVRKLAPGGALLFNTSNRHLRLPAVVRATARDLGLPVRITPVCPLSQQEESEGKAVATWAILARRGEDLDRWIAGSRQYWMADGQERAPVWRDNYANILAAIQF